jgi:hypothetical protein
VKPIAIIFHKLAHHILPVVPELDISKNAVGAEVVVFRGNHLDIPYGKDNLRGIIFPAISPLLTDILLIVRVIEVKVVFCQSRAGRVAFFLEILELFFDSPVRGVRVLEVALIEAGEKGKFNVANHSI